MRRSRATLAALALIAMGALISACGSTAPASTGSGSSDSSGGGGGPTATAHERGVKFAKCMRSNGVSEFPDPGASGKLTVDAIANGSSLDTSTPAFKQAISACKNLEPAGFMGSRRSSQQQDTALKFAQCIRANGVPDFPDPVNGQPLIDTNRIPSSNQPGGMTILNAATHKCGSLSELARGGQR
jgi:hypothetical protein